MQHDDHLRQALRHAPDHDQAPPAALDEAILQAAHAALRGGGRAITPLPWWRRLWQATGQPHPGWGVAFGSLAVVALSVGLWGGRQPPAPVVPRPEPVAPAPPTDAAATAAPAVSAAPAAATEPVAASERILAQPAPRPRDAQGASTQALPAPRPRPVVAAPVAPAPAPESLHDSSLNSAAPKRMAPPAEPAPAAAPSPAPAQALQPAPSAEPPAAAKAERLAEKSAGDFAARAEAARIEQAAHAARRMALPLANPPAELLAAWPPTASDWRVQKPGAAAPEPAPEELRQQASQWQTSLRGLWRALPLPPEPEDQLDTRLWQGERLMARWRIADDRLLWVDASGRAWQAPLQR